MENLKMASDAPPPRDVVHERELYSEIIEHDERPTYRKLEVLLHTMRVAHEAEEKAREEDKQRRDKVLDMLLDHRREIDELKASVANLRQGPAPKRRKRRA